MINKETFAQQELIVSKVLLQQAYHESPISAQAW
ncbi:hypothetical protein Q426_00080 [Streptococcus equi subsp. zooepidemicus CY]|nr:hypothetical protein Q426_00080 [Streptococcus equi subsp. zooepidemicus CY]